MVYVDVFLWWMEINYMLELGSKGYKGEKINSNVINI